jgi:hypothetical protein
VTNQSKIQRRLLKISVARKRSSARKGLTVRRARSKLFTGVDAYFSQKPYQSGLRLLAVSKWYRVSVVVRSKIAIFNQILHGVLLSRKNGTM